MTTETPETSESTAPEATTHPGEVVREEVVEVTVLPVRADDDHDDDDDDDDHDDDDDDDEFALAVRRLALRQLDAGQDLSIRLVDAATDASVAITRVPATVVAEIRSGADLPTAVTRTGTSVRGAVGEAGQRARAAIGNYVGTQATLPNAVVVGAADVAEAVLRAQRTVTTSALTTAFSVATAATLGDDVRAAFDRERAALSVATGTARGDVTATWDRAAEEIRGAVRDYDDVVAAFDD